jgi:hypothetical protein
VVNDEMSATLAAFALVTEETMPVRHGFHSCGGPNTGASHEYLYSISLTHRRASSVEPRNGLYRDAANTASSPLAT